MSTSHFQTHLEYGLCFVGHNLSNGACAGLIRYIAKSKGTGPKLILNVRPRLLLTSGGSGSIKPDVVNKNYPFTAGGRAGG